MKTPETPEEKDKSTEKSANKSAGEVHTDFPLSEKDEVKIAEQNLQKGQQKPDK